VYGFGVTFGIATQGGQMNESSVNRARARPDAAANAAANAAPPWAAGSRAGGGAAHGANGGTVAAHRARISFQGLADAPPGADGAPQAALLHQTPSRRGSRATSEVRNSLLDASSQTCRTAAPVKCHFYKRTSKRK
jgi:hypothetical protein